ncbi:phosphatidate cytidylyltransferase [Photorhabdus luminescens]|uniref:Phosphatidate cytidylyltransferase n=1 Tax=Photorhabdus akhurstii TaxID=171438 RepID=A0ABX8LU35_9GAMM|nr:MULTISPECIES: phosphatidate cytidylyltransferase [Photorhabdus]KGM27118.1 CDP-diglyceride synthetase [Photorhabdus luminescens]MBS9428930.1 phosphatidate cytidylyltransferase [Photorhabdus akhurstii]MCC8457215.1 phosphatidate cytidylyltransferase [Photorhabdus aegyptia]PQQ28088.1 phosphatidate cytidylyltransferase [Photorhabdus luminescens]PQQ33115.1 phosphatidate cytidylyltransferase [Photorhabdus luminescens]
MLKYRLITAVILIPLVIAALFLLPPVAFGLVIIAVSALAAWEWGQFAGLFSQTKRAILAALFAIGLLALQYTLPDFTDLIGQPQITFALWGGMIWWIVATLLVVTYPSSAAIWKKSILLRLLFGILTLVPFYCGMMVLRTQGYGDNSYYGAWWLLYVMLLVWGADSGAYLFGRTLGKRKMAPKVSPGKTLEGLIGGLMTAAIISWLFGKYAPVPAMPEKLMLCSAIVVIASVFGDLTESMFKRESGIKDSSQLIPGHGGVMDRIDSLTAAIPVFAGMILLVF